MISIFFFIRMNTIETKMREHDAYRISIYEHYII